MANLIAVADGNLTSSSTWAQASSVHASLDRASRQLVTTAYVYTATAVIPNGEVVDGVALMLSSTFQDNSETVTVSLHNGTSDIREVSINVTDILSDTTQSSNGSRQIIFFKFASTVTGDGSTAYKIGIKMSATNLSTVSIWRSSTANNYWRLLRTTTTAAPAAGDNMVIAGEYTAAATYTARTVTMDNTTATDYCSGVSNQSLLGIGARGTLTWPTNADTYLRISGDLDVSPYGACKIGTVATPVGRANSAIVELDCASDGQFIVRADGTFSACGESRTASNNTYFTRLNADHSAGATTITVDDDTGWKNGDEVAIAPTSTTRTQHERRTLNANAGSSSFTISSGLTNAHLGSGDSKGGVILLSRNVTLRTTSSSFRSTLRVWTVGSNVELRWVALKYFGANVSNCSAIEVQLRSGNGSSFSAQYVVVDTYALCAYRWSNNYELTLNDCCAYSCQTSSSTHAALSIPTNQPAGQDFRDTGYWTVNRFRAIDCVQGVYFSGHMGSSLTVMDDIYIAGCQLYGVKMGESTGGVKVRGQFSNWEIHSSADTGMIFGSASSNLYFYYGDPDTVFDTWKIWACTNAGVDIAAHIFQMVFKDFTVFGCSSASSNGNIRLYRSAYDVTFDRLKVDAGGGGASSVNALYFYLNQAGTVWRVRFRDCEFDQGASPKSATTHDVEITDSANNVAVYYDIAFDNCLFGSSGYEFATFWEKNVHYDTGNPGSGVAAARVGDSGQRLRVTNYNQTDEHWTLMQGRGYLRSDTSVYKTAAPSEKLTPVHATRKCHSGIRTVPVAAGATVAISVWTRKDGTYDGNAPRLVMLANPTQGADTDQVLDTMAAGASTWEQLSGVSPTALVDGVFRFYVDCDGGTAFGSVNVDDWTT